MPLHSDFFDKYGDDTRLKVLLHFQPVQSLLLPALNQHCFLFLIIMIITAIQFVLQKKWVNYD